MGTRGALAFVVDGDEKVMYNHCDSYPSGLGDTVAEWLRENLAREDEIRAAAKELRAVDSESAPTEDDFERLKEFHDSRVDTGDNWYALLRETQGNPDAILKAGVYEDASDFPLDSLWFEWAYVVDFDARRFEVHRGFQHEPATEGRWSGRQNVRSDYYPVRLVAAWRFDELPAEGLDVLLDDEDGA